MALHPTDGQRGAEVSAPSSPRWEVADLFRLSGEASRRDHLVPPSHRKVMRDLAVCRTAELGGHAERCPSCAVERYAYNACRHRHCPKGQTLTKAPWLEDRQAELWPVPYFHTVFPLPHALHPLVLANKSTVLTMLCKAASQTLLPCGRHTLGGQLGFPMVLHTWDQTLGAHCHVHCVIAAGALSVDGERWMDAEPRFLFPVRALRTVFRGKCLDAFHHVYTTGTLTCSDQTTHHVTPTDFATRNGPRRAKEWVVSAKPPCAGPAQVLDSIGRSTHRIAISNTRLVAVDDGHVRFTYRNRRQGKRLQSMTLDAYELMRRFLLHVLPRGCVRIRHFGCLASRCKAQALRRGRALLGQVSPPLQPRKKRAVAWMQPLTGIDLTPCPHCGHRPLLRGGPLPRQRSVPRRPGTALEVPCCDSS